MHPWHDVNVNELVIHKGFPVVVEVPMGSKNKYELDKETGLLRLDRVLYSAVYHPANYGFVPRTYCGDGDPVDVLVLGQAPIHPLTIVEARAIGLMRMRDEKGLDNKLLAVNVHDPAVAAYQHHSDLPKHTLAETQRFFEDYKILEHKDVAVDGFSGPEEALSVLRESLALYDRWQLQQPPRRQHRNHGIERVQ